MDNRLQKFVCLVDSGSFTQASRELHISQPALTTAIHKLERELQATLLIRDTRSLRLTPAGKVAYDAGKALSIHMHNLTTRLAELAQTQLTVSIGMIDSVAQIWSIDAESLRQLDAQAQVALIVNNSRILEHSVLYDELDIAFVAEQPRQGSDILDAHYVATEPLVIVCHADYLSQAQQELKGGQLTSFLSYDQASHSYRLIQQALTKQGITPVSGFYSTSPDVMLRLVLLNKGVAALPYLIVKPYLKDQRLAVVRSKSSPLIIERRITVLSRKDRILSMPHRHIIAQTRTLITELHKASLKL